MKRIFSRLMLLAFAATIALSATGCPADDDGTDTDLSVHGDMATSGLDLKKD